MNFSLTEINNFRRFFKKISLFYVCKRYAGRYFEKILALYYLWSNETTRVKSKVVK